MSGVLVARLDNAGDVLLAGPAVRAVAASGRPVTFLAGPNGAAAARLLPGVGEVLELRAPWIDLEPPPFDEAFAAATVDRLRATGCSEAVILTSAHQSALPLAVLLRVAGFHRIGGISRDHAGSLLDVRVRGDPDLHEVERGLLVAEACGYSLPPGDDGALQVSRRRGQMRAAPGYVVLHPGASAPARRWSVRHWRSLAELLRERGERVIVTGSAAEGQLAASVAGDHAMVCAGSIDLEELADVLAGAACLVCGNTGPAHLAATVGTPVVSLFAPTVPARRWHPWRVPHVLLGEQDIVCAGCRAEVCPVVGHPCVDSVRADTVVAAIDRLRRSPERDAA